MVEAETEAAPQGDQEKGENQLETFFENLEKKLSSEEGKDILSGLNIVGAALEKGIPAFLSEILKAGLPSKVLGTASKFLSLEDVVSSTKAMRCYAELLEVVKGDYEDAQKAQDIESTVMVFTQLTTTVLEKSSGSSPGKGSPKKDGTKELTQHYSLLTESLVRIYTVYNLSSSKLVVLSSDLAELLQGILVGAKDKQSALVKGNVLLFLAHAPLRFPSELAFQSTVESTLEIVAGPHQAYVESTKRSADEGEGSDEAGAPAEANAAAPTSLFKMTEEYGQALAAAAVLLKNNGALVSDAMLRSLVASVADLNMTLYDQYDASTKALLPSVAGAELILELLMASEASAGSGKDVVGKCMECKIPSLLAKKVRLLVYGQDLKSSGQEAIKNSVSEMEATTTLRLMSALLKLAGEEERLAMYEGMNHLLVNKPEPSKSESSEVAEAENATGDEAPEGGHPESAEAETAAAAGKDGEEEEGKDGSKEEEEDPGEGLVSDGLVSTMFVLASGNLAFESIRVQQEEQVGTAPEPAEGETTEGGETTADAEAAQEGESEDKDKESAEEEGAAAAESSGADAAGEPLDEKPVDFLVQDSAARVLYTMATSSLSKYFSDICVPSTVTKMIETGKGVPQPVLSKLLIVLLYINTDTEKTKIALEKSSLCLGGLETRQSLNVASSLCVMSSFKIDLEALLPIKCPPEPSPPPTPPPPPLATNKFLWDALGRPEMIDGGNLPTIGA